MIVAAVTAAVVVVVVLGGGLVVVVVVMLFFVGEQQSCHGRSRGEKSPNLKDPSKPFTARRKRSILTRHEPIRQQTAPRIWNCTRAFPASAVQHC